MSAPARYKNRSHAGRQLARALRAVAPGPDALVLALPRGGVPVAFAVATELRLPMDIMVVRKVGLPGHEEYAMGAMGSDGVRVLQRAVIDEHHITPERLDALCAAALHELQRRERHYRGDRPPPRLAGRTLILVDDGIATGSSMRAALEVARAAGPARLIIAAPVGAPDTCQALARDADALVCPLQPPRFHAVGQWYQRFDQTSDEEVQQLLAAAWRGEQQGQAA